MKIRDTFLTLISVRRLGTPLHYQRIKGEYARINRQRNSIERAREPNRGLPYRKYIIVRR